jgi:phosphoglycerate dehydrogenase-like enzyme
MDPRDSPCYAHLMAHILVTMPENAAFVSFFPPEVRARLEAMGDVSWNRTGRNFAADEFSERLAGIDICVTAWGTIRLDAAVLRGADRLRLLAHTAGTVAGLVSPELYDRGVQVVSGNRAFAESVAESVIAYSLLALRRLPYWTREIQEGRWKTEDFVNEGLLDQAVGLVGFGTVARFLVPLLRPFRARIRAFDPHVPSSVMRDAGVEPAPIRDVISLSKVISIHAAKTPETRHLVDAELLRLVPDGAVFVNTARGSVVDEAALASELATLRFQAVLDVFQTEPPPPDSPLRGLPNAILVPHMAGPTVDRRRRATLEVVEEAERLLRGEPLAHPIDRAHAMSMTQ